MRLLRVIPILCLIAASLAGCFKLSAPPIQTRGEAEKKFLQICKEESQLAVTTKALERTLYIYLPIKHAIFEYKAAEPAAQKVTDPQSKRIINFFDARLENETVFVDYDISVAKSYPKDYGYASAYTEEYQKKQNNILTALYRAYADLGEVPGDVTYLDAKKAFTHEQMVKAHIKTENPPDFIVLIIADIQNGLENKGVFNFLDYKKTMTQAIPQEEFNKRYLNDLAGSKAIINDEDARHIEFKDLTWREFLAKQIANRVNFKYQRSDFPPKDDDADEILKIVNETFSAYNFGDFRTVKLHDLAKDKEYLFDKSQLKTFAE